MISSDWIEWSETEEIDIMTPRKGDLRPRKTERLCRVRAHYGIDRQTAASRNERVQFTILGEVEEKYVIGDVGSRIKQKDWRNTSGKGLMHPTIAEHLPALAYLIKWHEFGIGADGSADNGPRNYLQDAMYFFQIATGKLKTGQRTIEALEHFKTKIVFGAVIGDGGWDLDAKGSTKLEPHGVERWLKDRLPELIRVFKLDMEKAGVL